MSMAVSSMRDQEQEERKTKLLAGLREVRERILTFTASMSAKERDQIYLGIWSSRELLAHLAGWDETNLRAANEVLSGEVPSFYEHYDKDWTSYNAGLVVEYSRDEFEELLALVRHTHGKLLAFIENLPASELWKDRGIRARGWKVTIGRLLEVERDDEEEHFLQLKQFMDTGAPS